MNLKLESVDAVYSIETDRLCVVENYVPTEDPSYVVFITDRDDLTWAKRKLFMRPKMFVLQKALWDIDGIPVRNGAGAIIPKGEVTI